MGKSSSVKHDAPKSSSKWSATKAAQPAAGPSSGDDDLSGQHIGFIVGVVVAIVVLAVGMTALQHNVPVDRAELLPIAALAIACILCCYGGMCLLKRLIQPALKGYL